MDPQKFVRLQLRDAERVVRLIGERQLKPRDASLMFALMARTDTSNNRIHATTEQVAKDLQCNPSEVRSGVARLKKQHLLRLVMEKGTGKRYYLLNPWVVQSGGPAALGLAMKQFQEA